MYHIFFIWSSVNTVNSFCLELGLVKCMDLRVGLWRKLNAEELMLLNCGVGEESLESPLDCKEIQPVHSKGDQSWDFFGKNDAKVETPVLGPPHAKSWLIGKYSDAGKDWGQEEKGMTEDEMTEWHHQLDGRESEWTLGVGDGQGGLACCSSWGRWESDMTEQLNWTKLNWSVCWSETCLPSSFLMGTQHTSSFLSGKQHQDTVEDRYALELWSFRFGS